MSLRFTVLASGSAGNASLVEAGGVGLLIDAGLGPRQLATRLAAVGASWSAVHAVVLTHAHSDHWKDRTLAHLHRHGVPLYCHPATHPILRAIRRPSWRWRRQVWCGRFRRGRSSPWRAACTAGRCRCGTTAAAPFGFRLEGGRDLFGRASALGYVADLGCWDDDLAAGLADVDVLALEFNHDVAMEIASGRSSRLIDRVLGDEGHLSNAQGASLLRAVLARSEPGRVRHLVQLHLSRECNRPTLAARRRRRCWTSWPHASTSTRHDRTNPAPRCTWARPRRSAGGRAVPTESAVSRRPAAAHPRLPGLEEPDADAMASDQTPDRRGPATPRAPTALSLSCVEYWAPS